MLRGWALSRAGPGRGRPGSDPIPIAAFAPSALARGVPSWLALLGSICERRESGRSRG